MTLFSEPFSLNEEFHWCHRTQEESKFNKMTRVVISYQQGQSFVNRQGILSSFKMRHCHLSKKCVCSWVIQKRHHHCPHQKRAWTGIKAHPDLLQIHRGQPVCRENQPHYYLDKTWGGRVCKTWECWGPRKIRKNEEKRAPFKGRIHRDSYGEGSLKGELLPLSTPLNQARRT